MSEKNARNRKRFKHNFMIKLPTIYSYHLPIKFLDDRFSLVNIISVIGTIFSVSKVRINFLKPVRLLCLKSA